MRGLGGALIGLWACAGMAFGGIELTDIRGRSATVDVIGVGGDEVTFVIQGRKGTMKLSELDGASREAAIQAATEKGTYAPYPPMDIQVKITNQRRNDEDVWYRKDVRLSSSVVITGRSQMTALPAAEATILIITQDTRQKYVHGKEVLDVFAKDSISIPAAPGGMRREFAFRPVTMSLDTARDKTNVGGDEYKYYLFALRDPETGAFIHFESNDPRVEKYVAANPQGRTELLDLKKGAKFHDDFDGR